MSDDTKVVIELDLKLEDGSVKKATASLPKKFQKAGKKAGDSFNKGFSSRLKSLSRSLLSVRTLAASLGGTLLTAFAGKELIKAASIQEDAINRLNSALRQSGDYTPQLSASLQEYASSLQEVTKTGDEAILGQLAFAQSMGATVDQSKEIVKASLDMAAALDIDFNSAVRNIAKTLGGYAGELGEVIPELKNLTQEQLRNGEGVNLLASRYKGFAEREVKTFSGAMAQLGNTFGDLKEDLGFIISKSPLSLKAIDALNKRILSVRKRLADADGGNLFKDMIVNTVNFGIAIADSVLLPLELAGKTIGFFFSSINTGFGLIVAAIGHKLGILGGVMSTLGLESLGEKLTNFSETSMSVFNESLKNTTDRLDGLFGEAKAEQIKQTLSSIKNEILSTNAAIEDSSSSTSANVKNNNNESEKSFKNLGSVISGVLKNEIVRSLTFLGASLIKQENFFDGFMSMILDAFGNLLIGIGTAAITVGTTAEAIKASIIGLFGGQAIVAGVASIAVGGALKAYAASMGGSTSGAGAIAGGGGQTGASIGGTVTEQEQLQEETEPQTQVVVNIQGDILDSDESGSRIIGLINDAVDGQGVTLNRSAIA